MSIADFVHDALHPLRGPPAWLVLVVTPLTLLGQWAGMAGVPLLAVLGGWVWTYTFLMAETTAHGLPPPVLSIERTNPWHEPRALVPLLVALCVGWGAATFFSHGNSPAGVALATAALLLTPASLAVLAIEDGLVRAFWPPALLRVAIGLGGRYPAIVALGASYVTVLALLAPRLPAILLIALAQFALFSFAALLGKSLYRRRDTLALDAWHSPEREERQATAAADRAAEAVATEIYGLLRVGRDLSAAAHADAWLSAVGRSPSACRWLRDRALLWNEPGLADHLDGVLVSRLIELGRRGEAIGTLESCWNRGGTLPTLTDLDAEALLAAAVRSGHDATVARLHMARSRTAKP